MEKCLTSPETREIQIKTAVKKCWPIKVVNTVLKFYIYSFKNEMSNMSRYKEVGSHTLPIGIKIAMTLLENIFAM